MPGYLSNRFVVCQFQVVRSVMKINGVDKCLSPERIARLTRRIDVLRSHHPIRTGGHCRRDAVPIKIFVQKIRQPNEQLLTGPPNWPSWEQFARWRRWGGSSAVQRQYSRYP